MRPKARWTWVGRAVRGVWRSLLRRLRAPEAFTRARGRVCRYGELPGGVAFRVDSAETPPAGPSPAPVSRLVSASEDRFLAGALFEPLREAAQNGAVLSLHVVQGDDERRHLLTVFPRCGGWHGRRAPRRGR